MKIKIKNENGEFKEAIIKGLKGDQGEKGEKGDNGDLVQQEAIDDIKSSLERNTRYMKTSSYLISEFGIDGLGTEYENIFFKNALEYSSVNKVKIIIPDGFIIKINEKIVFPNNVNLEFGENTIILSDYSSSTKTDSVFTLNNNVTIKGLYLDCNNKDIRAININNANNVKIIDSTIKNSGMCGLKLFNVQNSKIENCYIENTMNGSGDFQQGSIRLDNCNKITINSNFINSSIGKGIACESSAFIKITNNLVENLINPISGNDADGIYSNGSTDTIINNNIIINVGGNGIKISQNSYRNIITTNRITKSGYNPIRLMGASDCVVSDNILDCENSSYGIDVTLHLPDIYSNGNLISNNLINGTPKIGIRLNSAQNTICESNRVENTTDEGILVELCKGSIIRSNIIEICGGIGINVNSSSHNTIIDNNNCLSCLSTGFSSTKCNGLTITNNRFIQLTPIAGNGIFLGSDTNDIIVNNNNISGFLSNGIYNSDSNAILYIISGNIVKNCGAVGIRTRCRSARVIGNMLIGNATNLNIESPTSENIEFGNTP